MKHTVFSAQAAHAYARTYVSLSLALLFGARVELGDESARASVARSGSLLLCARQIERRLLLLPLLGLSECTHTHTNV
jgi:hypothetical protein